MERKVILVMTEKKRIASLTIDGKAFQCGGGAHDGAFRVTIKGNVQECNMWSEAVLRALRSEPRKPGDRFMAKYRGRTYTFAVDSNGVTQPDDPDCVQHTRLAHSVEQVGAKGK